MRKSQDKHFNKTNNNTFLGMLRLNLGVFDQKGPKFAYVSNTMTHSSKSYHGLTGLMVALFIYLMHLMPHEIEKKDRFM